MPEEVTTGSDSGPGLERKRPRLQCVGLRISGKTIALQSVLVPLAPRLTPG